MVVKGEENTYPPWIMKSGMQRCMVLPLKCSFLPDLPRPRSPVHKHLKFSAVLGTTSASRPITILQDKDNIQIQIGASATIGNPSNKAEPSVPSNGLATYLNVEKDARVFISLGHHCASMQHFQQ